MEEKFYSVADCHDLCSDLLALEEAIKYLVSIPKDHEDKKYLTPELIEAFGDVMGACEDLMRVYDYYSKKF